MKVKQNPSETNAFYFDGSWESGIKLINDLNDLMPPGSSIKLLNFGRGNPNYLDLEGYGYVSPFSWVVYPYSDKTKCYDYVKVFSNSDFEENFTKA